MFFAKETVEEYKDSIKKNLEEKKAKETIEKTDKKRAAYYNYYTGDRWGDIQNYHLSLNTDTIGVDNCVDILEKYVKAYMENGK